MKRKQKSKTLSLTKQEIYWLGEQGNKYIKRNNKKSEYLLPNLVLFKKILHKTSGLHKVIEFGANVGYNLLALNRINPKLKLSAVEINHEAVVQLKRLKCVKVFEESILEFNPHTTYDFVFTKGLLIHINPQKIQKAYAVLFKTSSKYICIAEYYNPYPIEIVYRKSRGYLFKRDFCGEFLKKYNKKVKLIDYGFTYHLDKYPQDDLTWFLLRKV